VGLWCSSVAWDVFPYLKAFNLVLSAVESGGALGVRSRVTFEFVVLVETLSHCLAWPLGRRKVCCRVSPKAEEAGGQPGVAPYTEKG